MFKKYLFIAAIIMGFNVLAKAEQINAPSGKFGDLATADYGGVAYSTNAIQFSTNPVLGFYGQGSVVGFIASTNTSNTDFVTFHDTDSVKAVNDPLLNQTFKVQLSSMPTGATVVLNGQPYGGTYFAFPKPVRFLRGCAIRANVANVEMIRLLYTKFDLP